TSATNVTAFVSATKLAARAVLSCSWFIHFSFLMSEHRILDVRQEGTAFSEINEQGHEAPCSYLASLK
ncbi:hypothetical protein ACU385_005656, partial [Escherichia coli]